MSTVSRLISGSLSSWIRIIVSMVSQMALVPIFLTHWSVTTYGVWIATQALVSIMATLDTGHQTYLGYEFLKLGKNNLVDTRRYLWSGAVFGVILGLIQILFIYVFIVSGVLPELLHQNSLKDAVLMDEAGKSLLFQGVSWLFCGSVGGLLSRALYVFGYYPRFSWWNVLQSIVTSSAPAIAVLNGASLMTAGLVLALANIIFNIPLFYDVFRLFKKEGVLFIWPSFKLGFKNFSLSLALSGKSILENARQQGARIILAPIVGTAGLAAFSTMRTGANVALQGLGTIVNPLEPELMRFLHQRDQAKSEAAFGTVWVVVVLVLAPAVLVVQVFIEPLYVVWTKGQIQFNPWLFAMLSQGVLVYAVAQPAMAVVIGNNLLKPQLTFSALSAIIVIGGIIGLVPFLGITGAGLALLVAEIASTTGYRLFTKKWLSTNGLRWPKKSSIIAITSVWIAGGGMALMIILSDFKWIVLILSLALLAWNGKRYWLSLPLIATENSKKVLMKLPGVKLFFAK